MPERWDGDNDTRIVSRMGLCMAGRLIESRTRRKDCYSDRRCRDEALESIEDMVDAIARGASPGEVWDHAADAASFLAIIADNYQAEKS